MKIAFEDDAYDDLSYWAKSDKNIWKKINALIKDIRRDPLTLNGIGHPEFLRDDLSGYMSRRITEEHRLVYTVTNDSIIIAQCKGHYTE